MSTVHYGGIKLSIVLSRGNERRVVYDGPTYIYTRYRLRVQAVYNPEATSYVSQGGPPVLPVPAPTNPANTDSVIRHVLSQPRQKLVYTVAGEDAAGLPAVFRDGIGGGLGSGSLVVLDSPPSANLEFPNIGGNPAANLNGYVCDVNYGPKPTVFEIRQIAGTRTWVVEWGVEVALNECYYYYSSPAVLLSHRWRMTHDVDRDGFATRTVQGHAIFRSDVLLAQKATPDDFRASLLHPVPVNMRRYNIRVTAHPNEPRADYSFTDVEQSHMLLPGPVTRVEAFATVGLRQPADSDLLKAFLAFLGSGLASFGNIMGALEAVVPQQRIQIVVRCWGSRRARRADLQAAAARVMMLKFPMGFNNPGRFTQDGEATYDLLGRYVQLRASFVQAPTGTLLQMIGGEAMPQFPELLEDDVGNFATTQDSSGWAMVPNDNALVAAARGTYLEKCVAQGLQAACSITPTPVNVPAQDKSLTQPGSG